VKILSEPIDVIVKFKGKEKPVPYKFRYLGEEEAYHEIKIDKVITIEETKIAGIKSYIYRCQSQMKGMEKIYEIKYIIGECRWELYKI
jgi:hypothetical protein